LSGVAVTAADGLSGLAEDSNQEHNHTFWSFDAQSQAQQVSWASGKTLIGDEDINYLAQPEPLGGDDAMLPPPDPKLFATYDGALGTPTPVIPPARTNKVRRTWWRRSRTPSPATEHHRAPPGRHR